MKGVAGRQQPVLYITRNGLLEPLGQSQVMSYLRGLSQDYDVTLVTFEKPKDMVDTSAMARARADCDAYGIRWLPQRFWRRPRLVAPAWSMVIFLWLSLREVLRGRAGLIHARSYLPAIVALVVRRLTGTPFIFDMRALWPEELITAGRLQRGSLVHWLLVYAERACLRNAAAVVSLTEAAVDHLRKTYPRKLEGQQIVVIPTCADLERFRPDSSARAAAPVYGCIGTVLSGWFRTDWLSGFFHTLAVRDPSARFEVVTRDDSGQVRRYVDPNAALGDRLSVYARSPEAVHTAVQRQRASVMFYAGGEISELGRSPTRMAEVLGCGIPVVANEGVGDVSRIIRRYGVGVIVADGSDHAMAAAASELEALLQDPALADRCRRAAEEVFSLEAGTEAYRALYRQILGEATPAQAGSVDE